MRTPMWKTNAAVVSQKNNTLLKHIIVIFNSACYRFLLLLQYDIYGTRMLIDKGTPKCLNIIMRYLSHPQSFTLWLHTMVAFSSLPEASLHGGYAHLACGTWLLSSVGEKAPVSTRGGGQAVVKSTFACYENLIPNKTTPLQTDLFQHKDKPLCCFSIFDGR